MVFVVCEAFFLWMFQCSVFVMNKGQKKGFIILLRKRAESWRMLFNLTKNNLEMNEKKLFVQISSLWAFKVTTFSDLKVQNFLTLSGTSTAIKMKQKLSSDHWHHKTNLRNNISVSLDSFLSINSLWKTIKLVC